MKLLNRLIGLILLLCFLLIFVSWFIGRGNHATFFLYQKPHEVFLDSGDFELHIFRILDERPEISEYIVSGHAEEAGCLRVHSITSTILFYSDFEIQDISCSVLKTRSVIAESSDLVYITGIQPNDETPSKNAIISFKLDGDQLYIEKSYGFLLPDVNGNRWIEDVPIQCIGGALFIYSLVNLLLYVKKKEL